jgi:hypothetical protein
MMLYIYIYAIHDFLAGRRIFKIYLLKLFILIMERVSGWTTSWFCSLSFIHWVCQSLDKPCWGISRLSPSLSLSLKNGKKCSFLSCRCLFIRWFMYENIIRKQRVVWTLVSVGWKHLEKSSVLYIFTDPHKHMTYIVQLNAYMYALNNPSI